MQTLTRQLIKEGFDISIVGINCTSTYEEENDQGVHIYRLPANMIKGLKWYYNFRSINNKLLEMHQNNPIDIVESTEMGLAFIKKRKEIKYIIRLNGGHHFFAESEQRSVNRWKGFQEKRSFAKADRILGVSEYVLDHTAKYIDFAEKRGPVVYNPANFARFYEASPEKKVDGRIFFAGTICEKKGVRQLILAMPMIKKEFVDAHLIIAGRDWKFADGSSYINYIQEFINPEVRDFITFLGPVDNDKIPALIEEAEVCVYPSHMEAMPLAWIEVMSMGKAFVGSNTGPAAEIINHGITGLMCNPLNVADIAEKTISVLKDKDFGALLGRNARADMLNRFATKRILQQNIDFYRGIV